MVIVKTWGIEETQKLSVELLEDLFKGNIGAIRIPNFISKEICEKALNGIKEYGVNYYEGVYPKIGKIGTTQFEHRFSIEKKKEYFKKAVIANQARESIFRDSGDLAKNVIRFVGDAWPHNVDFAIEEETGDTYFAGLVRVMGRALIHVDWAGGLDGLFPEWTIGKINAQLAWNIYLQPSANGGSTVVYNRPWKKSDEAFYKLKDSYAYDYEAVKNAECIRITPQQGELVFFNPQNYHEVQKASGSEDRITVSSFAGLMPNKDIVFWS
ncbi:histidine kinase [Bacillus cytotoxicus]|uniref:2OG-Fe(II)-dependent halogenase WelO5 family protein n=1 Tax=Bacillus cytotoxicus TaxID=580165 RepID=UPI003D7DDBA0